MEDTRRGFIGKAVALGGLVASRGVPGLALAGSRGPIFQDRFERYDPGGWGRPWFNQRYGRHWAVTRGKGLYRLPAVTNNLYYRPNPILVLDHDVSGIDLQATMSANNATSRFGLLARATGYASYYAAYLGPGNVVRLGRFGHHHEDLLAKRWFPVVSGRRYRLRLQVRGTGPVTLRVKVWPATLYEPAEWTIEHQDADPAALLTRGAFGIVVQHALDGRGVAFRGLECVAWSPDDPTITAPEITYALAGPPTRTGARVAAKISVPATVGFDYGPEPTLSQGVVRIAGIQTSPRAQTAKADFDLTGYQPGATVYWRPVAERRGHRVYGPVTSFVTGPGPGSPVTFAFGSCTKWDPAPRTSFEQARLKLPGFYLHQGDLGYVAHRVVSHAPDTYQDHWTRMLMDPNLRLLTGEVPFAFYRDDADYGINDADAAHMRRFVPAAHDELNANRPGPYFFFRYGDLAVFVLDCRRFSSGRAGPVDQRFKLGDAQKDWLFTSMTAAVEEDAGLLVVASPQAFGSDNTPAGWRRNYAAEWNELMGFFTDVGRPVLIVSGDAHGHRLHEYPQRNLDPSVPRIVEFVSAGTEQNKFSDDLDPDIAVRSAHGSGFGVVQLGPETENGGERTRLLTVTAYRSTDGRPFWSNNYLVVRNLGIFPLGGI